ncbi:MAG: FprA family A-type flavoprotein [Clostridia bacterium]|nr:FprA family A-type flavoprotein [Clostridia bacterium]
MKNEIINLTPDVKWIGVKDPGLATFDVVMETKYGTTYNSFFIDAHKKTIVEATKENFWDEYLKKIQEVCNPADIQYIIVNHSEPDHSGNLKNLLRVAPDATVVGTGNAIRYLRDLMGIDFKNLVVKDGDTLDLGNKTLHFISAPNLHWPDTMFTWLQEDQVLFTCDCFGAHYSSEHLFDDEITDRHAYEESFKYYFDVILAPYSKFMRKAIDKIRELPISIIATGHGPVLRRDWKKIVELSRHYADEAMQKPRTPVVFIPYVSAYQKTGLVANLLAEGIRQAGNIEAHVLDIELAPLGEVEQHIAHASAYLIGSPTINQNILMPIYKCFALINPIRDKGKPAAGFGSFGWSGEAKKIIRTNLENLKLSVFEEEMFVKFTPDQQDSDRAIAFGKAFGQAVLTQNEKTADKE